MWTEQPQASLCRHFVENAAVFFISEFFQAGFLITKSKVVETVNTCEIAAPGDLNGAIDGDPLRYNAVVKAKAPVLIALGFHTSSWYHTTRPPAKSTLASFKPCRRIQGEIR